MLTLPGLEQYIVLKSQWNVKFEAWTESEFHTSNNPKTWRTPQILTLLTPIILLTCILQSIPIRMSFYYLHPSEWSRDIEYTVCSS
jgi:hypothetical protein